MTKIIDDKNSPSIEVGSRVFLDFGNSDTALWGGPGTVVSVAAVGVPW